MPCHLASNSLAAKSSEKRLTHAATGNWLEMGLLSVNFVARTTPDGQLALEMYVYNPYNHSLGCDNTNRHDIIHTLLGVPSIGFEKQHQAKTQEMKRMVLDYVKSLKGMTGPTGPEAEPTVQTPGQKWLVTEAGFPKIPANWKWFELNKIDLEHLFRDYISRHYCRWQLFSNIGTETMCVLFIQTMLQRAGPEQHRINVLRRKP